MKSIIDQCLPARAAALLRTLGHECFHVEEIGMRDDPDEEIILRARAERAVIVTADADFHQLIAVGRHISPSVVRIRIPDISHEELANRLAVIFVEWKEALDSGALLSVDESQTRAHPLPVREE